MSRTYIQKILFTTVIEIIGLVVAFFIAYSLRSMRDWIPYIQLPMPYISYNDFIPFIIYGIILWCLVFIRGGLYTLRTHTPIFEEIRRVITYSFFWFFVYIGFIYLSTGFLFVHEIPRLIIFYTYILATIFSILIRYTVYSIYNKMYTIGKIAKEIILVITDSDENDKFNENNCYTYIYKKYNETSKIKAYIRDKKINTIVYLGEHKNINTIFSLARIYGIPLLYPKISKHIPLSISGENWMGGVPMIELSSVSITAWGRIAKRIFDIVISTLLLIILIPVFFIISLGIHISDSTGPIIYRNRRIGQNGRLFALYKFRYMYWQYCTKEEYGIDDEAMSYEEKLKKEKNTREGPLYKIENDPRRMKWGILIERLSLDELPQLYNVLIGDMSLIGPRPHQPREIDLYEESDKQVLTIKPGITGMAQVYGRDKNTFKNEILLDTYYIEHYSISLDIAILLRTFFVVCARIWSKQ